MPSIYKTLFAAKRNAMLKALCFLVFICCSFTNMYGATRTASVSGNWTSTATWGGAAVPIAGDIVIINNLVTVTVNSAVTGFASFTISSGGTLIVTTGGSLTTTAAATSIAGTLQVTGGTITIGTTATITGSLQVSSGACTVNTTTAVNIGAAVTVSGAGNLTLTGAVTFAAAAETFTVSGGTCIMSATLSIGANAASSLIVNGGALYTTGNATVSGSLQVSSGSCNIGSLNSNVLTVANALSNIAVSGSGVLNVSGRYTQTLGTYNQTGGTVIVATTGNNSSANASFAVTGGSMSISAGSIILQQQSTGATQVDYNVTVAPTIATGTLQLGNLSTPVSSKFNIQGKTPNIVLNSFNNPGFATTAATTVLGDMTLNGSGTFTKGNFALVMQGNSATNPGNITVNGTNTLTLNGSATLANALSFTSSLGNQTFNAGSGTITSSQIGSLTINNSFASSTVTIPNNLTMLNSSTLTLTSGILNTSMLTMGTNAVTTLVGGSANSYINGALVRTFGVRAQSALYDNTTLFPVGKTVGGYLPLYLAPTNTVTGLQLKAEPFGSNTGTNISPLGTLSVHRWEASAITGGANMTNVFMQQNDAAIASANIILKASAATGVYGSIAPATTYASGNLTTATAITAAEFSAGYFSYGDGCYAAGLIIAGPSAAGPGVIVALSCIEPGTWTSSNPGIAAVNATTGVVTANAPGTVTITLTVVSGDVCNGSVATKNFTVANCPGGVAANLQLWLKADAGITLSGSNVTQWNDQSVYARSFTQATSANQPAMTTPAIMNYNPALSFNGVQFMDAPGSAISPSTNSIVSVFSTDNTPGDILSAGKLGYSYGMEYRFNSPNAIQYFKYDPSGLISVTGVTPLPANTAQLNSTTADNTTNGVNIYMSGALDQTGTLNRTPDSTGFSTSVGSTIVTTRANFWHGLVGETIVYNTILTAADRQKIESYLALKYGIILSNSAGGTAGDILLSDGTTAWSANAGAGAYHQNVIGILRDNTSVILQKQSHTVDDSLRIFVGSLAADNPSNTGTITNNLSAIMIGSDGGKMATSTLLPMPAGITSMFSKTWKITNTNFSGTFSIEIKWDSASMMDLTKFRLLVSHGAGFSAASASLYGAGQGVIFSAGSIIISGLNSSIITPGDNYITVGATTFTLLPVGLTAFNALLSGTKVNINWQTASDTNTDYFIVEKSVDGSDWAKVAIIKAVIDSSSLKNYSTVDYYPYNGVSYYRLKQVKLNGEYAYSDIRSIKTDKVKNTFVAIYPNPASGQLTIKGDMAELNSMVIYTLAGQDVTSFVKTISKTSTQMLVDISRLSQGEYNIKTTNSIIKLIKK